MKTKSQTSENVSHKVTFNEVSLLDNVMDKLSEVMSKMPNSHKNYSKPYKSPYKRYMTVPR